MADWNSLLADEAAPEPGAASPSRAPRKRRTASPDDPFAAAGPQAADQDRQDPGEDPAPHGADHDGKASRARRRPRGAEAAKAARAPADPAEEARAIVLRQLTGAARSRRQLADKLAEKQIPADVAEAVLDRFEEVRLIDDAEFARMWVRSRSRTRSLARGALRRELSDKGITGDLAEEALAEIDDDDEYLAAVELVRRRLPARVDLSDRDQKDRQTRRLVSMLARRGYPPGLAYRAVGEVMGEELQAAADTD